MESAIERFEPRPPKWQSLQRRLKEMSETELRSYLAQRLQFTADNLLEMALVIREFDQRGIDLSDLRLALLVYLRRIAYGQTLPQVVALLAGRRDLLQRVAFLPLPEQERCMGEKGLTVVTGELAQGEYDTRQRQLLDLESWEVRQLFGPDGIRNEFQQAVWLKGQAVRAALPKLERPTYVIEKNTLIVNRPTRLTKRDLHKILAAM
ncbi:MAG: hypothetical protein WCI73_02415 [Phycisphaerae bacterium]